MLFIADITVVGLGVMQVGDHEGESNILCAEDKLYPHFCTVCFPFAVTGGACNYLP